MNRFSVLIFAALSVLSTMAFAGDLQVMLQNPSTFVIDSTTRSCTLQISDPQRQQSDDVSSMFVTFSRFSLSWTGAQPFTLAYVQVSFPELSGGPVTIGGTELGYLWSGAPVVASVPSGTMMSSSPDCNFSVGGLQIPNKSVSFSGHGTFLVYGTTLDASESPIPVSAKADFNYIYVAPGGN